MIIMMYTSPKLALLWTKGLQDTCEMVWSHAKFMHAPT